MMMWLAKLMTLEMQSGERYLPTAFDSSLSILEKVNKTLEYLNKTIEAVNTIGEYVDDNVNKQKEDIKKLRDEFKLLKEWIEGEGLKKTTLEILEKWFEDGTLSTIINEQIFGMKVDKVRADEYMVNAVERGVLNDGTNQQEIMQRIIDENDRIFFPNGTYLFDKLVVGQSNKLLLFGEKVILKSSNNEQNVNSGGIEIKGEGVQFSTNIVNNIIEESSVITVQDISGFAPEQFVYIEQNEPVGTTPEIEKQKWISAVCQIKSVDVIKSEITVYESIPHSFQLSNSPVIRKINMVENVKIIGSGTLFDKMGTITYSNFINVDFAYDVQIKGFNCVNGGGKGVRVQKSHTYEVSNIKLSKPTRITSGQGYAFQAELGSAFGVITNIKSKNARHTVDFAKGAYNAFVRNCIAYVGGFNGHGMNTKHIVFQDCDSYGSRFGVGNDSFGADSHWKFINCTVHNSDVGFSVSNQSSHIEFINCKAFKTLTSMLILQESDTIKVIGFETDDCTTGVDVRGSTNIELNRVHVSNFRTRGILVRQSSKDVKIIDFHTDGATTSNAGVECIYIDSSSFVDIIKPYFRNKMRRAIAVAGLSHNILIDGIDAIVPECNLVIEFNNTISVTDLESRIVNAINLKGSGLSIHSHIGGLDVISSRIESILLELSTVGYNVISNRIDKTANIRSTQNTSILNNYGKATSFIAPENGGTVVNSGNRFVS